MTKKPTETSPTKIEPLGKSYQGALTTILNEVINNQQKNPLPQPKPQETTSTTTKK
jgi:hypothetical protein